MTADFREVITHPTYLLPFFKEPGRLVTVRYNDLDFGWGVVIRCRLLPKVNRAFLFSYFWSIFYQNQSMLKQDIPPHQQYIVDVLLNCAPGASAFSTDRTSLTGVQPCPRNQKGVALIVSAVLTTIHSISQVRICLPKDLRMEQSRETIWKSVLEVKRRFPDGIPLLDPVKDMKIKDNNFTALLQV